MSGVCYGEAAWERSSRGSGGRMGGGPAPETLEAPTCAIECSRDDKSGAAGEIGVSQATGSDTRMPLGKGCFLGRERSVCQPRECTAWGECACSNLLPDSVASPTPGARAGGSWQVKKGLAMSPTLCICCLAKSPADLPHSVLQTQALGWASQLAPSH